MNPTTPHVPCHLSKPRITGRLASRRALLFCLPLLGTLRGEDLKDRAVSRVAGTHFLGGDALVFLARRKTTALQCVGFSTLPVCNKNFTDLAPVDSSSSYSSAAQPPTALACHPGRPWPVAAFAVAG